MILPLQVTHLVHGGYQDILMSISEILNFKVRQFRRSDNAWGSLDKETGDWNGMISNLINGEADFTTATLDACCRRTEVMDFLWALSQFSYGFAIKSKLVSYLISDSGTKGASLLQN